MNCVVTGTPGSQIFVNETFDKNAPVNDLTHIATIPSSGEIQVKLNREKILHDFLFVRTTSESPLIPMGLDYSKRNTTGHRILCGVFIPTGIGVPIVSLPIALWMDNKDVDSELVLHKRQTANSDLNSIVMSASNPIEEINNLKPKEHKSSKKSRKNSDALFDKSQLVNKSGTFSVIKTVDVLSPENGKALKQIPLVGTVTFDCPTNNTSSWSVKLKGKLNGGDKPANFFIPLKTKFKQSGTKWIAKDKFGNPVEISFMNNGYAVLDFFIEKLHIRVEYDCSTPENDAEIHENDVLNMLLEVAE